MSELEESGMSIGDFAMSLMDSGKVSKKSSASVVATSNGLPATDVDISDVPIPSSMVEQVLQESFGMGNKAPKRETVKGPLLSEQELLQEKIISLREELVETINKLTSLVSEMTSMAPSVGQTVTQNGISASAPKIRRTLGRFKRNTTSK
tara:strand:- start:2709 stop:3158 length:450 start_codon:yes stop_codon:yes gene_type:complete